MPIDEIEELEAAMRRMEFAGWEEEAEILVVSRVDSYQAIGFL